MKSMEILSKDLDNQKNVFSETQKVGEEIISDQLSFKDEVQQLLNNCTETTSTTEKLIQENNEKLQKHLALKQSIEEKCLKFAALVQNFNTLLDNEKNSLVVPISSKSVEEIDNKIQTHENVFKNHSESISHKNEIETLHKEITNDLGDDSAKYSNFTFESISEKYSKIGEELLQRTEELKKEKKNFN